MADDEYQSFSVKVLEGLEPAKPRLSEPVTQPGETASHYMEFQKKVAEAANRLFDVEHLPRTWGDSVIRGFNILAAGDVIDSERRAEAAEALARTLGEYHHLPLRTGQEP